jgi:MYXO-CTERM domain-containing protein
MRKTIAVISATGALLFGGAGVADAAINGAPASPSTSTTLADNNNGDNNQHGDDTGKWGMFGLLGLFGLAGLKRRNTTDPVVDAGSTATRGRV